MSEEDIETKEKTLFMAMSTPLASSKNKRLAFFEDEEHQLVRVVP